MIGKQSIKGLGHLPIWSYLYNLYIIKLLNSSLSCSFCLNCCLSDRVPTLANLFFKLSKKLSFPVLFLSCFQQLRINTYGKPFNYLNYGSHKQFTIGQVCFFFSICSLSTYLLFSCNQPLWNNHDNLMLTKIQLYF